MSPAYLREMEHARRDIGELVGIVRLAGPVDLTITQLAEAIGLASMAHAALLRAAAARERQPLTLQEEVFAAAVMRGDTDFDL